MSKSQFEQLIEYVINDEEAKARELFHNIVVEKSRAIYENIMEETEEESVEEGYEEEEESVEEGYEEEEESIEEGMEEEGLGGDASDDLIRSVEADEQMEGEEEEEEGAEEFGTDDADFGADEGGSSEPATKDDIMDLEMKLDDFMDQLMAEFEGELGGDGADAALDAGSDMTDLEVADDEFETEGMMEAVTLKAAPKPVTSEEGNINKRSINADNAGAKGPMGSVVKPVHPTGTEAKGRPDPTTKDLIGDFQNKAGGSMKDLKPANKPVTAQASGVNTKSPLARRG